MPPPPGVQFQPPLENGACLDSIRAVPDVLQGPSSRGMQIVRIDQVVSTATMLPGEVIGFLYTTQDGSTWLGQRTKDYQSAADATAINRVLAAAHVSRLRRQRVPTDKLVRGPNQAPTALSRADAGR